MSVGVAENGRPKSGRHENDRLNCTGTKNGQDGIGRPENGRPNCNILIFEGMELSLTIVGACIKQTLVVTVSKSGCSLLRYVMIREWTP